MGNWFGRVSNVGAVLALSFISVSSLQAETQLRPLSCVLTPNTRVEVASPVPGVVAELNVERGDRVSRGEVLFRLNHQLEEVTVERSRAQESFLRRRIERNQSLLQQELISQHELDELQTEYRVAQLQRREAEAQLELRTTTAPISGVVLERLIERGEYVGENPVLVLVSLDPLYAEVVFPEELFGKLVVGQRLAVTSRTRSYGTLSGEVIAVDPVIDAGSETFGVRLSIPNRGHRVPAGFKCHVSPLP